MEASNLPTFLKFGNTKNQIFVLSLQEIIGGYETKERWHETKLGVCPSFRLGLVPPLASIATSRVQVSYRYRWSSLGKVV